MSKVTSQIKKIIRDETVVRGTVVEGHYSTASHGMNLTVARVREIGKEVGLHFGYGNPVTQYGTPDDLRELAAVFNALADALDGK